MSEMVHARSVLVDLDGFEVRADASGDGLTLAGYIARFGEPTPISDWLGDYTEELKRGAFARTLVERGAAKVKMQFEHGHDATFGALPIGVWTDLREDRKGLFGEGRVLDTWHTIPIRAALEAGALTGMSFRFKVIGELWRKAAKAGEMDHRTITEVALFEAGPVVSPAYEGTTVGLRSKALELVRSAGGGVSAAAGGDAGTIVSSSAAGVASDATEHARTEADPPAGITRREMRLRALALLGDSDADPDRGAA